METAHKTLLRRNRVCFAAELDLVEVAQILVVEDILSDRMVEEIFSKTTTYNRNVSFLNKLPTRGPNAFHAFCNALVQTHQHHLAKKLIPQYGNSTVENFGNITRIPYVLNSPPPSFSFSESTPAKYVSEPTCKIQSTDPFTISTSSPFSNGDDRSLYTANLPSEVTPARIPVEQTDVGETSDIDLDVQTPLKKNNNNNITVHEDFESLRSSASMESLKTAAGIVQDNHSLDAANNENNHIDINANHPLQQVCFDAPQWDNVQVRHTTTEFVQTHKDDCYPMLNTCKGITLLVNVTKFEPSACLDDRLGGEKDSARLELMFQQLSYEVYKLRDGTASEIWNTLNNFAVWPKLREFGSCFIVLMSHGVDGAIFGRDGRRVILKDVYNLFSNENCPHLQNKPKVFLVQACRGDQPDKGTDQIDGPISKETKSNITSSKNPKKRRLDFRRTMGMNRLPNMSDCLFAYATVPGYVAMRNTEKGSWFIQAFIQVVAFHARNKSLLDIMTMTNDQVKGREGRSPDSEFHRCKEMSEFTSCLCKPFYFFPGIYLKRLLP